MSFKENLKAKIRLDRLFQSLVSTISEPPGRRWLDKELTRELLARTDFEYKKVRGLHLYVRGLEGGSMEVAVLDNELAIYHTTVDDVTLRKSPYLQQKFSIRNGRKIMNDPGVIASKGKKGNALWESQQTVPGAIRSRPGTYCISTATPVKGS